MGAIDILTGLIIHGIVADELLVVRILRRLITRSLIVSDVDSIVERLAGRLHGLDRLGRNGRCRHDRGCCRGNRIGSGRLDADNLGFDVIKLAVHGKHAEGLDNLLSVASAENLLANHHGLGLGGRLLGGLLRDYVVVGTILRLIDDDGRGDKAVEVVGHGTDGIQNVEHCRDARLVIVGAKTARRELLGNRSGTQ